jgi:predicted GNAT family acetyltransferase
MSEKLNIDHQPEHFRFVSLVEGQEARLEYQLMPRNGIDFTYTFVPEPLRGHGIAEKLVRTGLAWAREQDYTIEASCWYVRRFLDKRSR